MLLSVAGCVLQFVASSKLPSTDGRVLLFVANYVFFVVCHGKGICPTLLGIFNCCVVHYTIGFDVGGLFSKFGLFAIGLGNVG